MHSLNDRVMFVDLAFVNVVYRMISVYMPHAGYPHADLCDVYDQLRFILLEAQQLGYKSVVGGDFNTQQHVGIRGEMLADLLDQFCLHIANCKVGPT